MLQDQGSKEKSPAHDLSPRSPPAKSEVNPLQELTRILHEYFSNPAQIPWKASIFGIEGVPLYISMQDIWELVGGSQMLNINIIQFWIM